MPPTTGTPLSATQQSAHKYGPSAVRDIGFIAGAKEPYVQVKQRKNGQYVVIERLPVHHKPRNYGLPTLQQSLAESEVKLNSLKPDWKPTLKYRDADKKDSSGVSLPPINLGWGNKATAMVGSLDNVSHEPGGGNKRIPRNSVRWDARSKVGSLDNMGYKSPSRTNTSQSEPIMSRRRLLSSTSETSPRYGGVASSGSLGPSMHFTPGGAEVVMTKPRRYENVRSRIGSLENISHVAGGGDVIVKTRRTRWTGESKVGSLDNVKHVAGGGDVSITNERLSWQTKSKIGSLDNVDHNPGGGQVRIQKNKTDWVGRSRIGSLANVNHKPGGGLISITNNTLKWTAQSKIDTKPPVRRWSLDSLDS